MKENHCKEDMEPIFPYNRGGWPISISGRLIGSFFSRDLASPLLSQSKGKQSYLIFNSLAYCDNKMTPHSTSLPFISEQHVKISSLVPIEASADI